MATEFFRGFGGLSISARTFGSPDDPIVVLVHSGGQSGEVWRTTAVALAEAGRYVVCPDLRGHGDSGRPDNDRYDLEAYVEDLRALLGALPARPVVVGAALGAAIALAAVGGPGQNLATGLVVAGIAPDLNAAEALSLAQTHLTKPGSADAAWATGINMTTLKQTLEDAVAQVRLPMMVVQGSDSRLFRADSMATMRRLAPHAEFIEIAGAGHSVASDRPELFQGHLLEFLEMRAPRKAVSYQMGSDARTLRDALGCFGTGVTIVTTTGVDGEPVGLTANSFTSVSLDPPLLLFCLARNAGSLPAFENCEAFSVNVLHIGQQPASDRFARRDQDRFAATTFEFWDDGVPILCGALASFHCRKHAAYDGGDHRIFVGEVTRARFEPRRDPLLYFRGRYRRLHFT